jgi:hypothetical protein
MVKGEDFFTRTSISSKISPFRNLFRYLIYTSAELNSSRDFVTLYLSEVTFC